MRRKPPPPSPETNWYVPPSHQGQIVEVGYSAGADENGILWEVTRDRSDGSVSYRYIEASSLRGNWEPWNKPPRARFRKWGR